MVKNSMDAKQNQVEVEVTTVDAIMEKESLNVIHWLEIDTEG